MENIVNNSLFLTHGGTLSGLYGILSSEKISSTTAMELRGDRIAKFTDPERKFKEEDNYLFFESFMDRGRLSYSGFVENNSVGFAFLLVASGKQLLNQVDIVGNSDGILLGRKDESPLEIDLKEVDYKILIPDSYQEKIRAYCEKIRSFGHNPPEHLLEFRSLIEIKNLMTHDFNEDPQLTQQVFCDNIGLNATSSDKNFNVDSKVIKTKTSTVTVSCAEPLMPAPAIERIDLNSAEALIKHLKERPTIANIQRNTLLLFNEQVTDVELSNKIYEISKGKPLVLDLINKPEELTLALNLLAKNHYSVEKKENGEERVSSYTLRSIMRKISKNTDEEYIVEGLRKCFEIIEKRDISVEECQNLFKKPEIVKEKEWSVGVNKVQYPNCDVEEVKKLMETYPDMLIEVWKPGMINWTDVKQIQEFTPIPELLSEIVREKEWSVCVNKVKYPNCAVEEVKKLMETYPDMMVEVWKPGMINWTNVKQIQAFTPIPELPPEIKEWSVGINKIHQISHSTEEVRELMNANPGKEIKVWKTGMPDWKDVKEMPLFNPNNSEIILSGIHKFRSKLKEEESIVQHNTFRFP